MGPMGLRRRGTQRPLYTPTVLDSGGIADRRVSAGREPIWYFFVTVESASETIRRCCR